MNTLRIGLGLLFPVILSSCTKPAAEMPSDFKGTALAAKATALHKIISVEEVAGWAGTDTGKIGIHYENYASDPSEHSIQYHWPSGKVVSLPGGHSIDEYHSVGIAFLESMNMEEFKTRYGSNAGLQKKVNELGKDSTLGADVAIAEARYIGEYAKVRKLEEIPQVGELAFWEMPIQALHVYADGVTFTVTVNLGEKENRNKAVEMVKIILNS